MNTAAMTQAYQSAIYDPRIGHGCAASSCIALASSIATMSPIIAGAACILACIGIVAELVGGAQ